MLSRTTLELSKGYHKHPFLKIILKAKNIAGENESKCNFSIVPIKPTIVADFPKMSEVKEGGEFVLSAKVSGEIILFDVYSFTFEEA